MIKPFVARQALTFSLANGLIHSAEGVFSADVAFERAWQLGLIETDFTISENCRVERTLAFKRAECVCTLSAGMTIVREVNIFALVDVKTTVRSRVIFVSSLADACVRTSSVVALLVVVAGLRDDTVGAFIGVITDFIAVIINSWDQADIALAVDRGFFIINKTVLASVAEWIASNDNPFAVESIPFEAIRTLAIVASLRIHAVHNQVRIAAYRSRDRQEAANVSSVLALMNVDTSLRMIILVVPFEADIAFAIGFVFGDYTVDIWNSSTCLFAVNLVAHFAVSSVSI